MKKDITSGQLYLVATPIGNLADITYRAVNLLKNVDIIACEDTRQAKKLLNHYQVTTKTLCVHEHNEKNKLSYLTRLLTVGKNIALISDAGTPLISDPGFNIVQACLKNHINVVPIPGPSAVMAALSASGMPVHAFLFKGFLPVKKNQQLTELSKIKNINATLLFFEAPKRLSATLKNMQTVFGGARSVVIAREITKQFESFYRGSVSELIEQLNNNTIIEKGECVILVAPGQSDKNKQVNVTTDDILQIMTKELPVKQAVNLTHQLTNEPKNDLYKKALYNSALSKKPQIEP